MEEQQSNIKQENQSALLGLNMDSSPSQVQKGQVSYALNAVVENFDGNSINYQNELANELCIKFPEGYLLIGKHFIPEQSKHIFFLTNPETGDSEIGYMDNNECIYKTYINALCLNFNIDHPIHKVVHKITNCTTEIYWTDGFNSRRYLDLTNLPYKNAEGTAFCNQKETTEIDCNKLKIQPNFSIPVLEITNVVNGGNLTAGTVQFGIQYCDIGGNPYTSYYSITNPLPIVNNKIQTADFNYPVGKSVEISISNIDTSGYFEYFNIAVIKTINNISSFELVGTYFIDDNNKKFIYNGQGQTDIRLSASDIFEKFPIYDIADDLTNVQDILVWKGLTSIDRINYQQIANQITLNWETWRIPNTEDYSDELNALNFRGYLRDEVYAFEIVFLLKNGKQTDSFHIPGRAISPADLSYPDIDSSNPDYVGTGTAIPYWKAYNTATVDVTNPNYVAGENTKISYQSGKFAYWESTETYPCNIELWGELAGKPIRHHKFPDVKISPIFENPTINIAGDGTYTDLSIQKNAIFPIGVKLDISQIHYLIAISNLTAEQKDNIAGFKIVRGNRDVNKSIIAKGILRNVGKYTREGTDYYFPNYPYNDLREDPFLLNDSNAYIAECNTYSLTVTADGEYQYTSCFDKDLEVATMTTGETKYVCSLTKPVINSGTANIAQINYDKYKVTIHDNSGFGYVTFQYDKFPSGTVTTSTINSFFGDKSKTVKVIAGTSITVTDSNGKYSIEKLSTFDDETTGDCYPSRLSAFTSDESKYRQVFNSPETSFGQPFLGSILKLETAVFGAGKAHFTEVKNNALYKLVTKEAQQDALLSSEKLGDIPSDFSATAMFTAYQAYLQIYLNGITRRNYGWSYNSILSYNYYSDIDNNVGIKQRLIDNSLYLSPTVQNIDGDIDINNYQRETSVYIKTKETTTSLPYPSQTNSLLLGSGVSKIEDKSRYIASQINCSSPEGQFDISSVCYYASIKDLVPNQWGQIYSYETIDTGFQVIFDTVDTFNSQERVFFGGDTFICKFAFKSKLPFFIDNRVGAPDDSDIYYDEIGNIAYPEYWHSARSILYDYNPNASGVETLKNIISVKAHNFDCPNNQFPTPDNSVDPAVVNPDRTFYDGKMYMFAYGIPSFYCESSINVDLRQSFNNREGDFWPNVSSGIPDDWLQQSRVPISQDNTYYYNVTYSKQNKENYFSHLPYSWKEQECFTTYPFRSIFSEKQQSFIDNRINAWLVYRASSFFDFPQNYGQLVSVDGIDNKQVLARFENKSFLYNALYTTQTNVKGQVYLGQSLFSADVPPLDYAETDIGYVGSQHKFLLKIPQGQISIDAKRGQVFLLSGSSIKDISAQGSGVTRFLKDHLPFEILRYFKTVDVDNHFTGIGLHGVYDNKYNRVIITKLDYIPLSSDIQYDSETREFYIDREFPQYPTTTTSTSGTSTTTTTVTTQSGSTTTTSTTLNIIKSREVVYLTNNDYFCNKSWTLSFNFNTNSWISFHSYLPNYYISDNEFFYSGLNESCDIEVIAVEIDNTTTTSTSTINPFDCSLDGNFTLLSCELEGIAIEYAGCTLIGTADAYPTTTTTTTVPPTTTTTTTL